MRVEEAGSLGHAGESRIHYPLEDFRKGLEQDYNPEGRGRVIRGLAGLVQHNAIGSFEGEWVGTVRHQGGE